MKFFIFFFVAFFTTVLADVDPTPLPMVIENKEKENMKVPDLQNTLEPIKLIPMDTKEPIPDEKPIILEDKSKISEVQDTPEVMNLSSIDIVEPITFVKPILQEKNIEVDIPATELLPPKIEMPLKKFSGFEIKTFNPMYLKDYAAFPLRRPVSLYNQRYNVPYSLYEPLSRFQNNYDREYSPRINFPFVNTNVDPFYERPLVDYSYIPLPYNRLVIEPEEELARQPRLDDFWQSPYEYVYSHRLPSSNRFWNLF